MLICTQPRNVENALRTGTLFRNSPHPIRRIFQLCARSSICVLGLVNYPEPLAPPDHSQLRAYTSPKITLPRIYYVGQAGISIQIITFDPPDSDRMQYMSLRPISLALGEEKTPPETISDFDRTDDLEEKVEKLRVARLVDKLKLHTITRCSPSHKELALPTILNQINCSADMARLLQKNSPLIGPRRKRSMSVSERVVESAQSLYSLAALFLWNSFFTYVYPWCSRVCIYGLIVHRILAEGVLCFLELGLTAPSSRLLHIHRPIPKRVVLKDFSACCQQIHLRLQQFSYYPTQYLLLRQRHTDWSSIPHSNGDYIRFYNSLWLVANDVIIGIALGSYIIENADNASALLSEGLQRYTIEGLARMIRWLMSYPAGLKLNNELAAFLGDLFLWVIEYWSTTTTVAIMPHLPTIVYMIGFSSFAGASMAIAILSDLLSLLTLHIYSFYVASARIFNWQLAIIISLFHLFRGKKRNVLRNRIDNCDYDLDQLLLGTILFTLLFFLLPTVVVFYLTFACARMAIICSKAVLDTCLACLNHFPLFALMLRIKDSKRLPGGLHFVLDTSTPPIVSVPSTPNSDFSDTSDPACRYNSNTSYINLSSTPLSLRAIFAQYFQLAARIQKHYLSIKVLLRLVTGRFVPPLGRGEMYGLQYSMLPRERPSVAEVWSGLTGDNCGLQVRAPAAQNGMTGLPGFRRTRNGKRRK